MNMNVDIHLINRFNVGRQSVSRAIALTSDDKYWFGLEIVDSYSVFSGVTQRWTVPPSTQKIAWVVLQTTPKPSCQTSTWEQPGLQCDSSGRLTQKSVAVEGPKESPNCPALTLRIRISLSHSSLYVKTTVWLLHMNWPKNFLILEFNLKQFKVLGMSISREIN